MRVRFFGVLILTFFNFYNNGYCQPGFSTKYFSVSNEETPKEHAYYYELKREELYKVDTVVTFYSSNDQLRSLTVVSESTSANGPFFHYYKNGQLKSKGRKK